MNGKFNVREIQRARSPEEIKKLGRKLEIKERGGGGGGGTFSLHLRGGASIETYLPAR